MLFSSEDWAKHYKHCQAADVCYARIREIDLQWNPQEPIIYIPNKDPTYSAPCDHLPWRLHQEECKYPALLMA